MPAKKKTNEKIIGLELGAPTVHKASPYVLDLNKVMTEKKTAESVLAEEAKVKLKSERAGTRRLAFVRLFFFLEKSVGRFFVFLIRIPRELSQGVSNAVQALPRFFKFLRFALADFKKILSFGALAFLFVLPLQTFSYYETLKKTENLALGEAEVAYRNLTAGGAMIANADFAGAAESFGEATDAFARSAGEIGRVNSTVASLIRAMPVGGEKFSAGEALLFAGQKLSFAGENVLKSLADFSAADNEKKLTEKLKILRNHLVVVLPEVAEASDKLYAVNSRAVPEDKREIFQNVQGKLPQIVASIKNLISISDLMIKFLGDETDKRYLVVFQNPGEIRPTGGFMGSLALVDLDRGEVKNLEIPGGGSYDFQGSLRERVAAPEPLQLINARWQLQDANWFLDFPASAEKIKWFYEKSGGPTIDGVIAVNADLVADLLSVVGPIEMPEYGKILNKENFVDEIQKAVELEYDKKENKPKKIIADMAPKLITKLTTVEPKQAGEILALLFKSLTQKNLMLYSVSPETEHEIKNLGWAGEVKTVPENADYLAVVNSNIGGGKTDRVIEEIINLETNIAEDGYVKNTLTIKRTHKGIKGEAFTGVRNVDYQRVYVPFGSTLLSAAGFEAPPENLFESPGADYNIDADLKDNESGALVDAASGTRITSESGKTVFGNWVQVNPGEEVLVTLEYLLPFKISFPVAEKDWLDNLSEKFGYEKEASVAYELLVQKQPGANSFFQNTLTFPEGWRPAWQYGNNLKVKTASIESASPLLTDTFCLFNFTNK
jgi:hypothetical protein